MDPVLVDAAFSRSAMIPASNDDYARIEDVAGQLDMLR